MLHLAAPLFTPLFGDFPGKPLRMVGDLPAPAMRQWSRWCRHPQFAWGAEPEQVVPSLRSANFRIEAFSFTDDDAMTEACTCKLLQAMPKAPSTLRVVSPGDVGLRAIGHIGAFRPEAENRPRHCPVGKWEFSHARWTDRGYWARSHRLLLSAAHRRRRKRRQGP